MAIRHGVFSWEYFGASDVLNNFRQTGLRLMQMLEGPMGLSLAPGGEATDWSLVESVSASTGEFFPRDYAWGDRVIRFFLSRSSTVYNVSARVISSSGTSPLLTVAGGAGLYNASQRSHLGYFSIDDDWIALDGISGTVNSIGVSAYMVLEIVRDVETQEPLGYVHRTVTSARFYSLNFATSVEGCIIPPVFVNNALVGSVDLPMVGRFTVVTPSGDVTLLRSRIAVPSHLVPAGGGVVNVGARAYWVTPTPPASAGTKYPGEAYTAATGHMNSGTGISALAGHGFGYAIGAAS